MAVEEAKVPCGSCRACCRGEMIELHPEHGDDVEKYETQLVRSKLTGKVAVALKSKPNGDCTYLGPKGCTIYDNRPAICRHFDCRRVYRRLHAELDHQEIKARIRKGILDREVLNAGKARLKTLGDR